MDSIIIHTNMLFHIVMHTLSLHCMSQDWLKRAKDYLIIINFYTCYTTQSHCTQVSCPRLASRDYLLCMMNLACSGELESVYLRAGGGGGGEGPESGWLVMVVKVFGYIARHYLELDSKVSFCSRMKPLLDNLL